MKIWFTFLFPFLLGIQLLFSQQTIRGTVTDQQTLAPLVNAKVILLDSQPVKGALTDENGVFRIDNVPVGRQSVQVTYVGYHPVLKANLIVNIAQELIVNVEMEEKVNTIAEVTITSQGDKEKPLNELATVSARTFSVEEALRFAGSRNDPARIAQNFAGVSNVSDSRNDIIIRGNSPVGVLWRMEGIDIPNPNHFGALGTTGGPVSMVNNNNLSDADFMTSAFPAEYGNALAGVFDLNLRNGNNEQREFMGQIGFNGVEVGLEGPFSSQSRASYIANYRYSTLGVFKALGINFGTGSAVPEYQDLTFKIHLPTEKTGRWVLFGMGGKSSINFLESESAGNLFNSEGEDLYNKAKAGVIGLSHTWLFSQNAYGKLVIAVSGTGDGVDIDRFQDTSTVPYRFYARAFNQLKYGANYQFNKKFNARNHLRAGIIFDLIRYDLKDSVRRNSGEYRIIHNSSDQTALFQAYSQWQHRFSDNLSLNSGLHFQQFFLNQSSALEPRMGLKYQFRPRQSLSLGAGLHNQIQPIQMYFVQTSLPGGGSAQTNQDLGFTRSTQVVAGYDWSPGNNIRLKAETYYQWLSGAPVESRRSSFSLLNAGADFAFPTIDSLVNEGTGRNYGLELTAEKFFSKGYYFLFTASLFDSRYKGSDGIERNTAFNGNYIFNLLGGKEFKLGRNSLSIDGKITTAGGKRYSAIDMESSKAAGETVRNTENPWTEQYPAYVRADIKTTFRLNGKKFMQEWSVDLQNVTNHKNIFSQEYDPGTDDLKTTYQIGLFPVVQYRILL
ncbi:MAG: TonB-dependent receptor [Bacteroidia bacterium]